METKTKLSYSRVAIEPCHRCWGEGYNYNEYRDETTECCDCGGSGQIKGKAAMKQRRKMMFMYLPYDETGKKIPQKPNKNRPQFYRLQSCHYVYKDVAVYFNAKYALKLRDTRSDLSDELPAYRVVSPDGNVVHLVEGEARDGDVAYSSTTYSIPWEY